MQNYVGKIIKNESRLQLHLGCLLYLISSCLQQGSHQLQLTVVGGKVQGRQLLPLGPVDVGPEL